MEKNIKQQIETKYNQLLDDVKNKDFYNKIDLRNRVNCYTCENCSHITKTKDIDAGVTPYMFECEMCGVHAKSSFYRDIAPDIEPTWEWYRPSLEEVLEMEMDRPNMLDHILSGGLEVRKIKKDDKSIIQIMKARISILETLSKGMQENLEQLKKLIYDKS